MLKRAPPAMASTSSTDSLTSSEIPSQRPSLKSIACSICRLLFDRTNWNRATTNSDLFEGKKSGCGVCNFLLKAVQHFKVTNESLSSPDRISLSFGSEKTMQVKHELFRERMDIYAPLGRFSASLASNFICCIDKGGL
jgi:hypothetical protein